MRSMSEVRVLGGVTGDKAEGCARFRAYDCRRQRIVVKPDGTTQCRLQINAKFTVAR